MEHKTRDFLHKNKYIILSTAVILILAAIFVIRFESGKSNSPAIQTANPAQSMVTLTISGAVKKPGKYSIPAGSSLSDNLETFGGFVDEANLDDVKLDEAITKDKTINIKSRKSHGLNQSEVDELYKAPQ